VVLALRQREALWCACQVLAKVRTAAEAYLLAHRHARQAAAQAAMYRLQAEHRWLATVDCSTLLRV
jgi:hypothetical protein